MQRRVGLILFFSMVLSSCIASSFPAPTPVEELTPTRTNTPAPLYSIKVMSFNILYGGGADPEWEKKLQVLSSFWVGKDRLANFKKFIKEVNPDVLGLQEATGWGDGSPSVIQAVAEELGMYYYLSDAEEGMVQDVALLSKFEISEAENLPIEKNAPYGLKAKITTPNGDGVYIYVIHLTGANDSGSRTQACEVNTLLQLINPYMQEKILVMGDFNMNRGSESFAALEKTGLAPVQIESGRGIDQVWASPALLWSKTKWFKNVVVPIDISDHNPVAVEMEIYPGPKDSTPPNVITTPNLIDCNQ